MTPDRRRSDLVSPAPTVPGSLGILGGTFDPIHLAHLAVAEEVRELLGLEHIRFVPAGRPVHRPSPPVASAEDRLAMVDAAIAGNPAFESSRAEVDRPGPSYAVDTLEEFAAEARAAGREPDLTFILSAEAYAGLPTWRDPARILELCRMAVVPRPDARPVDPATVAARIPGAERRTILLDGPSLAVSGSMIRARLAAGRSIRYLVPASVAAYIDDHSLYADTPRRNPAP
jgi:nicotinate-nucleotide adenylyltransferase